MADHIRYDLLTQQALRGVVRSVLGDAAKKGLPGDHHFYISFNTEADGVRMSERLRAQYPHEMTIILQHQFWDLTVSEQAFEVGLSFGGIMERLGIPFDAINGFFDPSVQFGLQFEEVSESQGEGQQTPANAQDKSQGSAPGLAQDKPAKRKRVPSIPQSVPAPETSPAAAAEEPQPDKPAGGGAEVVRLDRFRKK
ncbi:MAG: hypothetical protein HY848_12010 [Betaproteobacteria bacterium]|nr:hypothetical protein [Betaproteobacteria bacterium]